MSYIMEQFMYRKKLLVTVMVFHELQWYNCKNNHQSHHYCEKRNDPENHPKIRPLARCAPMFPGSLHIIIL